MNHCLYVLYLFILSSANKHTSKLASILMKSTF